MKKILLLCLALAVVHEGCSVENDKTACLHSGYENSFVYKDLTEMNVASNSIFFMETTCKHEAGVDLSPRQACSVESAAMMNPHTQVYVVIISSVGNRTWSPVIQRLYEYKNVEIVQGYNEKLTQCQTDAFRSPDGKCIQMKYVRDRDNDCGEEVFFEVLLFVREHLYPTFPSSGTYPKMEFSNTVYVV
uniref:Secreted protein n=1 Tax=Cacopsylla melanoneura TaxID=428564 RepID=A0A8D9EXZ6_9HEMI